MARAPVYSSSEEESDARRTPSQPHEVMTTAQVQAECAKDQASILKPMASLHARNTLHIKKQMVAGKQSVMSLMKSVVAFSQLDDELFEKCDQLMLKYVIMEAQVDKYEKNMTQLASKCDRSPQNEIDLGNYFAIPDANRCCTVVQAKLDKSYVKFLEASGRASYGDDDDMIVAGEQESTNCPLTTMTYVKPMKSTLCGHTFSEHAIKDYLRKSTVCPVAGCQKSIRLNLLIPDIEKEVFLESQATHAQKQKNYDSLTIDDPDEEDAYVCK